MSISRKSKKSKLVVLNVRVISGKDLFSKNTNSIIDPYCEVCILDGNGNKSSKPQETHTVKNTLNPEWNQLLEFKVEPNACSTLILRCWDKRMFRGDRFLGQFTTRLDSISMLDSASVVDSWFPLCKRKPEESVSGEIHLQIEMRDIHSTSRSSSIFASQDNASNADLKTSIDNTNEGVRGISSVSNDHRSDEEKSVDCRFDKIRQGPSNVQLERFSKDDKDLAISSKSLEVTYNVASSSSSSNTSNHNGMQHMHGNVRVKGNRWYFEVKLLALGHSLKIGWCTVSWNPRGGSSGIAWMFDCVNQRRAFSERSPEEDPYGQNCTPEDIVGCGLDLDAKTMNFYRNGIDLGTAFNDISFPLGDSIWPYFGLSRRTKILINFGKDPFAYDQLQFNKLFTIMTEKDIVQLVKLFEKYRDIGNQSLLEEKRQAMTEEEEEEQQNQNQKTYQSQSPKPHETRTEQKNGNDKEHSEHQSQREPMVMEGKIAVKENSDGNKESNANSEKLDSRALQALLKDSIHGTGLLQFQEDVGITDVEEGSLIIAYKLKLEKLWEISRNEFINEWLVNGCSSIEKIALKIKTWREQIHNDQQQFRQFYYFVFDYLREGKKVLVTEEAIAAWLLLLRTKQWTLFDDFIKFLQTENKKSISRDSWQQLWHFIQCYPNDVKQYDAQCMYEQLYGT